MLRKRWRQFDKTVLFSIAIICTLGIGIAYTVRAEYRDVSNNLLGQAQAIATSLSAEKGFVRFTDAPEGREQVSYQRLKNLINRLHLAEVGRIDALFLLGQRTDDSIFLYAGAGGVEGSDQVPVGTTYQESSGAIRQIFQTGQPMSYIEDNEWGSWLTGAVPIVLEDGTIGGILVVYSPESELHSDIFYRVILPAIVAITGVLVLLWALHRVHRRQQALMYQRSVFLTTTSHDIRSPLRGIMWALELMKNPKADRKELIEKMEHQLKYVIGLVESVLAMIRADFALEEFKKTEQNIIPIIQEAIDSHQLSAEQYRVRIEPTMPARLRASVDKGALTEVANNLISNAIKYTKPGSTVEVKVWQRKRKVYFSVRDEGEGMTKEEVSHLFKTFYRTEGAQRSGKPGTGMGLALANDLVRRHKGKILVQSTPKKGSEFRVQLPKQ